MSPKRRLITAALCAAVAAIAIVPAFIHADTAAAAPATASPAAGAATASAARDMDAINADLKSAGDQFRAAVPSIKLLGDAKFRKENADKALPPLKKLASLLDEVAVSQKEPAAAAARIRMLGMAVAFGDKDSANVLAAAAASKDPTEALAAKSSLALGNWIHASDDAKAQEKILADYTVVAKENAKDNDIAGTLMIMSQLGPANEQMGKKAVDVITNTLTGEAAQQIASQIKWLDRPVVIAGRTTANTRFTSTSMKGKVILIDFWATWCGPCRESLPEVKKIYSDYHPKGLEIIGIDCDSADDKVNDFTKANGMPWVQLRERSQTDEQQWHPLTKKFGVDGIPTMFIIDKKGVLRYVDGREDTEAKVKKLLAEPDAAAAK